MLDYNGSKYSFIHILQGDIVGILDSNSTEVVKYMYDAWGKPIAKTGTMAATLGIFNPFRYRGYVFDEETGFFYLRSRYYNAYSSKFITVDVYMNKPQFNDCNLYGYCCNRPTVSIDSDGYIGQSYLNPWYQIGGVSVNEDQYNVYKQFVNAVEGVGESFNQPLLSSYGILQVQYSKEKYVKPSMFETIDTVMEYVDEIVDIASDCDSITLSSALCSIGVPVPPNAIECSLDYVKAGSKMLKELTSAMASNRLGHEHEKHTLYIELQSFQKRWYIATFDYCCSKKCENTLYGSIVTPTIVDNIRGLPH